MLRTRQDSDDHLPQMDDMYRTETKAQIVRRSMSLRYLFIKLQGLWITSTIGIPVLRHRRRRSYILACQTRQIIHCKGADIQSAMAREISVYSKMTIPCDDRTQHSSHSILAIRTLSWLVDLRRWASNILTSEMTCYARCSEY